MAPDTKQVMEAVLLCFPSHPRQTAPPTPKPQRKPSGGDGWWWWNRGEEGFVMFFEKEWKQKCHGKSCVGFYLFFFFHLQTNMKQLCTLTQRTIVAQVMIAGVQWTGSTWARKRSHHADVSFLGRGSGREGEGHHSASHLQRSKEEEKKIAHHVSMLIAQRFTISRPRFYFPFNSFAFCRCVLITVFACANLCVCVSECGFCVHVKLCVFSHACICAGKEG